MIHSLCNFQTPTLPSFIAFPYYLSLGPSVCLPSSFNLYSPPPHALQYCTPTGVWATSLYLFHFCVCLHTHTHSHTARVLGWGVGFSHRHWGPEIALELHYLRAVAAEAESREEKNQFSPRAPLSASTFLCPDAGAIPLFLFLPSVLPNKEHSPPHPNTDTNTLPPLNLLLQCSCQFQVLVVLKPDYAEGTIPHLWVSRGPPNTHSLAHVIIHPACLRRIVFTIISLASCAAMQFCFICWTASGNFS